MCGHYVRVSAALMLALALLAGCRLGKGPSIAEILADPAKYEGKTLSLRGKVDSPIQIFGFGTCKLDDGTGQLTVITAGTSRTAGVETKIEGKVKSAFNLGSKSVVVLIEEGAETSDEKP